MLPDRRGSNPRAPDCQPDAHQRLALSDDLSINYWTSGKQCRTRSDTAFRLSIWVCIHCWLRPVCRWNQCKYNISYLHFSCVTDGVKGWTAFVIIYTVPLIIIVVMNVTLYTLTWLKMSSEIRQLQKHLGQNPPSRRAALRAAKNMSLFVAAFLVQWSLVGIYGAWEIFTEVPVIMLHLATKFSNIGGVLNLCVFIVVHRNNYRKQQPQVKSKTQNTKSNDITETEWKRY